MPSVVRIPASTHQTSRRQHGIKIGCCRVCTCRRKIRFGSLLWSLIWFFISRLTFGISDNKMRAAKNIRTTFGWVAELFSLIGHWSSRWIPGSCCETLLIRFGMSAANEMGELRMHFTIGCKTWSNSIFQAKPSTHFTRPSRHASPPHWSSWSRTSSARERTDWCGNRYSWVAHRY